MALDEGLVERDSRTRKYFLGPLLFELGLLAEATQDTIYLSERSGLEAVCTNRALGEYPIKALPLDIGIRRPLGVGAGGLAMLCTMPEAEAEDVIQANGHRYEKFGSFDVDFLREAIAAGRRQGYSFIDSVVTPGTAAMGMAFPPENPVAAISVAAISGRLTSQRRAEIAELMSRQVRLLTAATAAKTELRAKDPSGQKGAP